MTDYRKTRYPFAKVWQVLFHDANINSQDVLHHARLPLDLFTRKSITVSVDEYFRFWEGLAFVTRDDPAFILGIVQAISAETLNPVIFATLSSSDLNTALERISIYKPLVAPINLLVEQFPGETRAIFTPLSQNISIPDNLAILELAFWVHIARMTTREHIIPEAVHMRGELSYAAAYEAFFAAPITKSNVDGLVFSSADAKKPFLTTNHAMWSILEPELNKRLQDLSQESPFKERVRACLLEMLASGHYSMSDVASKLAMSTRTLHRRLKDEETSFQKVLDELREELARHYLSTSDYSGAEIGFLLGYEETNSFYRAFRSWTGQTPEVVRTGG